ncbi:septation ring formation regulator EzrA [Compostibacillus humi]|uniref:Septation ring formation regulator EzrA n=1 Tax=Compostibacillus humi TaxID=1245525 RepID=A0A8J2TPJ6_9BACI|nr:septation ring formation regulator EzrA [Compostibacillus humi]GFZ86377.1 septation ring formation regulator EzrA [Compostibacillus humi]
MVYIIGTILVIIVLLIIGLIWRKRIYDQVDKLESWKLDLMGRDVASQLSKLKRLNLTGETQEKFETWKDKWEEIVTKELPDVEEMLFDAEEAADRFQFSKAKKILTSINSHLQSIEKEIEIILQELAELLESEEKSREEVEELEPSLKELRKHLSQHRYQYGKAEIYFDVEIDEIENGLKNYYELVEEGNYIEAKSLVDELKERKIELEQLISDFPGIYKACKHELPSQLDQLLAGIKEMKEQGFRVEHLAFEKEIHTYQGRLLDFLRSLEKGEVEGVEQALIDLEERIQEMYQLLEKEAVAKSYLESKMPNFEQSIQQLSEKYHVTTEEVEEIKKAYFLEDSDLEKYLSLGNSISALQDKLEQIRLGLDDEKVGHSELREELEAGFAALEQLEEQLEEFKQAIHNLRKEELEARDTLHEMRNKLYHLNRKLKKSNIPGVPEHIWKSIEETTNKNEQVMKALERKPLDIAEVQQALANASQSLEQTVDQTELMLDQAFLTERVIQYANRYRSKNPILAAKLMEAEQLFRTYQYELSLETAAKALEEVEPGALKRFENIPVEV